MHKMWNQWSCTLKAGPDPQSGPTCTKATATCCIPYSVKTLFDPNGRSV